MLKHYLTYIFKAVRFPIVFGFVLTHIMFLPFWLLAEFPYKPLAILTGNLFGGFLIAIFYTAIWFRAELPKLKADKSKIEV